MNKDYFEGVLQLRNPTKEVKEFVLKQVEKTKGVWIAKQKKVAGGVDLYLSSQKFLRGLGEKLKKSFSGDLKSTRKLFTRKRMTSKNVYRVTVMFRLPNFAKGDVVVIGGKEYEVMSIGKQCTLKDMSSGKKVKKGFDEINSANA